MSLKISVLTPSFNTGKHLERAIHSVIVQDYPNYEHIVVDGGSTDETPSILAKYPHIKWISEPDQGQSDAMNKAFRMSAGDIIVYLNADDYFEAGVFSHVVDYFSKHPATDILVGTLILSGGEGDRRTHVPHIRFHEIAYRFFYSFPYNPLSYFYRRKVQTAVGDFPTCEHYAMDYWFILRAFDRFTVARSEREFGTFFSDGNNKSSMKRHRWEAHSLSLAYLRSEKPPHWILGYFLLLIYTNIFVIPIKQWKTPFKYLVYWLYFRRQMSYRDFSRQLFSTLWAQK